MQLNLKKPICFFDLETTGVNITTDRIVEISILKVFPDGKEEKKNMACQSRNAYSCTSHCNTWNFR